MRKKRRQRGFTLLELLLVVSILSAATALTIGAAGPMSAGQRRQAAIASAAEALQRARLLALRGGGASVALGATLVATPAHAVEGMESIRTRLPQGWSASLAGAENQDTIVHFGPDGASEDVALELRGPKGAGATLRVLGISGQVVLTERAGASP